MAEYFRNLPRFGGGDSIWTGDDPASVLLRNEFFGIAPPPPSGGITYSAAQISPRTDGSATDTFNVDIGAASADRIVLVCLSHNPTAARTLNSATIAGVSATVIQQPYDNEDQHIWFMAVVPSGTGTQSISYTLSGIATYPAASVWVIRGANTTPNSFGYNRDNDFPFESLVTISVPASGAIFGVGTTFNATAASFASSTSVPNQVEVTTAIRDQMALDFNGTSSGSFTFQQDTTFCFSTSAVSFAPASGGGSVALTANNLVTGSTTLGTPTLNQTHQFSANNLVTGNIVLGTPAVGQRHALEVTGVTTGSPILSTPIIAQGHTLSASPVVTGAPALGTPSIAQSHVLGAVVVVTGATALGTPSFNQVHQFTANNLVTGNVVLGTPLLSSGGVNNLSANSLVTGSPVLGSPNLNQSHSLTPNGLVTGTPVVPSVTLGQVHSLNPTGAVTGAPTLGNPTLGQRHNLSGENLTTGNPVLGTTGLPTPANLSATPLVVGEPVLGQPALSQDLGLTANDIITGEVLTGNPTLYQYNLGDLQVNYNRSRTIRIDLLSQEPRVNSQLQQTRVAPVNTRDESRVIKVLNENRTLKL